MRLLSIDNFIERLDVEKTMSLQLDSRIAGNMFMFSKVLITSDVE